MLAEPVDDNEAYSERQKRKVLSAGCLAHIIHDGLSDMLFVFFPVWQQMFALNFAQVGLLKTLFSGSMALFQIPVGKWLGSIGLRRILFSGAMLASGAIFFSGQAETALFLAVLLALGGLASSAQHPRASSAIAQVYGPKSSRVALTTYNFTGDIGKLLMPALAGALISRLGWQTAIQSLSGLGLAGGLAIFCILSGISLRKSRSAGEPEKANLKVSSLSPSFAALCAIGVLDSATRMGFLTFLPFLLREKAADMTTLGLALALIFAGGVAGKFVCGIMATRIGAIRSVIITEACTALLIACLVPLPLWGALCLCPLLGVALNGTSSVLYGSVPELVGKDSLNQAFAVYYTATIGSGAVSPFLYGLLGDAWGLDFALIFTAFTILLTIPLTYPLRGKLAQ